MPRTARVLLMYVLLLMPVLAWRRSTPTVKAESALVTWRGQVGPVVFRNCTSCHHTGGSGPFDLTNYASARRWGPQIADVVQSRYMPPWLPEPTGGPVPVHFEGDRRLRNADIELLTAWVKGGMPEGEGTAPKPPAYTTDWQMGPPDLILEMPMAVAEPASGADRFVNFALPTTITGTRWIRAMEIQPGAGALVHHANLIVDRTASFRAQHPADWQTGVPGMDLQIDSGDAFDPDSHFLFWKPDSTALVEPPGMPWRLDPGNDLVLNMHLKPTGKPEQIRARVGLYFAAEPARAVPMLLQLEHDAALDIPAGDPDFVVTDQLKLPVAVDVLGIYPHAHYLGHEMKGWATLPNGQEQPLILIKSWDIDRQSVYRLEKPLSLPAGTVLHMRYSYDNSARNVHNPASPPVRVRAGDRATDEMSHLWIQVLPHELQVLPHGAGTTDPRYALDQAWMADILRKSPNDPLALYNLGTLNQMGGRYLEAEGYYRRLLAERPDDPRARTSLGSAMEASGDLDGAAGEYKAALAADPNRVDAAYDLAMLDVRSGQGAAAEPLLRRLVQTHPKDTAASEGLAQALVEQNRPLEAQPLLEQILAEHPEDAEAHRLLAMCYAADGDLPKTIAELRGWTKAAPEQAEAHRALAQVLSSAGQAAEAIAEQRIVLKISSENANDWNDLGTLEARAGLSTEARSAFEHALKLNPHHEAAGKNLAILLSSLPGVNAK